MNERGGSRETRKPGHQHQWASLTETLRAGYKAYLRARGSANVPEVVLSSCELPHISQDRERIMAQVLDKLMYFSDEYPRVDPKKGLFRRTDHTVENPYQQPLGVLTGFQGQVRLPGVELKSSLLIFTRHPQTPMPEFHQAMSMLVKESNKIFMDLGMSVLPEYEVPKSKIHTLLQ